MLGDTPTEIICSNNVLDYRILFAFCFAFLCMTHLYTERSRSLLNTAIQCFISPSLPCLTTLDLCSFVTGDRRIIASPALFCTLTLERLVLGDFLSLFTGGGSREIEMSDHPFIAWSASDR